MANIYLLEHNSSRLLFFDSNVETTLNIESTTTDPYCTEKNDYQYQYMNDWLLGKLNDKIYMVEDVGIYDSNHEHTAKIYNLDGDNQENIIWNVTRQMEYSEESDRLYCEHSGSFKILLIDSPSESQKANFYIKYERNLPGIGEYIGRLTNEVTGETYYNCIVFYKYDGPDNMIMSEVLQMNFNLSVVNDDNTPMSGINYCNILPKKANIDFSRISIEYNISANTSNDVKLGMVGLSSLNKSTTGTGYRYSKFLSPRYFDGNDNIIQPMYFIVQPPKNRSWICFRICYGQDSPGPYSIRTLDGCNCYYIRVPGAGLNGYYGTYNNVNDTYKYEIVIDRTKLPFILMIPKIFWNYSSIKYYDTNNNIKSFDGQSINIFNELDGMYYKIFKITSRSSIAKIILEYNAS